MTYRTYQKQQAYQKQTRGQFARPSAAEITEAVNNPLPIQEIIEEYTQKIESLENLRLSYKKLPNPNMQDAFEDILCALLKNGALSRAQWSYLDSMAETLAALEPIYGDFKAILVMFRFAGEKIKFPRIRLCVGSPGEVNFNYFELWFFPHGVSKSGFKKDPNSVEIQVGGWQGSGNRRFGGWIKDNLIIPYSTKNLTREIRDTIQEFSLDPLRCAQAMAAKLSACMYCGQRLSDDESKQKGYGPICANTYGLPWGQKTNRPIEINLDDLVL